MSEGQPANGDPPTENEEAAQYKLPDPETLKQAGELVIKDEHGKEAPFKLLYEDQSGRQLIVFIRHFYCGHCEAYVSILAEQLPPSLLATTSPPTTLTIIGCGEPACIPDYRTRTMSSLYSNPSETAFKIYTDRQRALYEKFGMLYNLKQADHKPDYITGSIFWDTLSSMKNIFTSGPKGFQGGAYAQNGGEWLFEGGELKWCRRMRNTMDHTEVRELKEVLGLS